MGKLLLRRRWSINELVPPMHKGNFVCDLWQLINLLLNILILWVMPVTRAFGKCINPLREARDTDYSALVLKHLRTTRITPETKASLRCQKVKSTLVCFCAMLHCMIISNTVQLKVFKMHQTIRRHSKLHCCITTILTYF